jgi:hypothetical protein
MRQYRRLKYRVAALMAQALALVVMYFILNFQAQLDPFLRAFNLMGTMIHEGLGHATWAVITWGKVHEIVVFPDGSGHAMTSGGDMFWILPAGYLSTTILMAVAYWINNRGRLAEIIPFAMGLAFIVQTWFWGDKITQGGITHWVGYGYGALLFFVGVHPDIPIPGRDKKWEIPEFVWLFVTNVITMYLGLGGLLSIDYISRHSVTGNSDDLTRFADAYVSWANPAHVASFFWWISVLVWVLVLFNLVHYWTKADEAEAE